MGVSKDWDKDLIRAFLGSLKTRENYSKGYVRVVFGFLKVVLDHIPSARIVVQRLRRQREHRNLDSCRWLHSSANCALLVLLSRSSSARTCKI